MPTGTAFQSPQNVDHHLKQLKKALDAYRELHTTPMPDHLLLKRLCLALRFHEVTPIRRSVSDHDWGLNPQSFAQTEDMFQPWKTQSAAPRTTPRPPATPDPDEVSRRAALQQLADKIAHPPTE